MRTSVVTFDTRARQRFYALVEQVQIHARPGESHSIGAVVALVRCGDMPLADGHALLADVHYQQQQARQAA